VIRGRTEVTIDMNYQSKYGSGVGVLVGSEGDIGRKDEEG
jgi:hypothetical protein